MKLVSRDQDIGNVPLTEEEDGKLYHLVTEEEQVLECGLSVLCVPFLFYLNVSITFVVIQQYCGVMY